MRDIKGGELWYGYSGMGNVDGKLKIRRRTLSNDDWWSNSTEGEIPFDGVYARAITRV